jgi:transposase
MTHLSLETKESIIQKVLSRGAKSIKQVAKESGIGQSTLEKWMKLRRDGVLLDKRKQKCLSVNSSNKPPLQHILVTAGLDEEAVGAYCREEGIHSFQLKQWQDELMTHDGSKKQTDNLRKDLKALRDQNKLLKKDLNRKDKALAETSALLVLKKKANLIWGDLEED